MDSGVPQLLYTEENETDIHVVKQNTQLVVEYNYCTQNRKKLIFLNFT